MSDFEVFLRALLVLGSVFFTIVCVHINLLRAHTKNWVPTVANVSKLVEGGEASSFYRLQYMFDGETYRIETSPWLFPTCSAKTGSQITVLVNPSNPKQCATMMPRRASGSYGLPDSARPQGASQPQS